MRLRLLLLNSRCNPRPAEVLHERISRKKTLYEDLIVSSHLQPNIVFVLYDRLGCLLM